ncbi:hypothetical protein LCGC14_2841150 [marine sediment metagenome]|uniref:Uncharacterized protein n=1 Tax=marine sediment metagenome TaxID=412755 RepID=A0A0F8YBA6_9ZZZZ
MSTEFREDTPHESQHFGRYILAVRKDIAEALADGGDYISLIVDAFGRLHTITTPQTVANSIKVSPVGGAETVDASGTAQPLVGVSTDAQMLFVQAKSGNTGAIYFGDSAVDKTSSKQTTLLQSQAVTVSVDGGYKLDINEFFIDADNNDDGVDFLYL